MSLASQENQPSTSLAVIQQKSTSLTPLQQSPSMYSTKFPSNSFEIVKIKKLLSQHESTEIVEINNCPTTLEASKLISNATFRSALESLKNFTTLILKIDEKLNDKHAEKPKTHEFKIERNFLISYESIKATNEKIIYWKNGKEGNYLTINLMKGYSAEMTDFVRDFLINNVNMNNDNYELANLKDKNNLNLLMKAVETKQNSLLIKELLNLPFDINQKSIDGKTAADIAWQSKNFQILLQLLEANSTFPNNFNDDELETDSENIKKFLQISKDMHDAVWSINSSDIRQLIKQKLNLRYFYNYLNVSAAAAALNAKNIDAYEILLESNCSVGPNENLNEIIDEMYGSHEQYEPKRKKRKLKISNVHDNASKPLPEKHLMILCANSHICHDDQHVKHRFKIIREAYDSLNEIPITKEILQLISMHTNFKIFFDPNRSSIEFMNPHGGNQSTRGLYEDYKGIKTASLYIAAKELLLSDGDDKFAALGTLAHELCHFVMNLTFCNNSKPYAINDEENKEKFDGIIASCKLINIEKIVSLVFNYDEDLWPAELIVRVPHMIAQYKNNSTRLNELKVTYKDLFDYYNDVVVPKMNETMTMLEQLFNNSSIIKFNDLTDAYKAKIHHSNVEFQGVKVKFSEIVEDENSEIFQHLCSKQIRENLIEDKSLSIGCVQEIATKFYTERHFIDYDIKIDSKMNRELKRIWTKNVSNNLIKFNDISSIADSKKMILLSDHAGAGKTTTFKHLSLELKSKFPHYWISYIDLKRYLKVYEKFEQNIQIREVLQEILSITDKIEIEIFTKLFDSHKVILLYDGVDEIAPKFKDFFIRFIDSVRKSTQNQQWIATRPQHMQELKEKFNQKAYKLLPYDDAKKIELIENVLENLNVENINAEDVLRDINGIMSYKNGIIGTKSHENKIDSPLMIQMMTELYANDKTILKETNLFSHYDKMIEMKKKLLGDKGEIANEYRDNRKAKLTIWQVHQIYALKLIYKNGFKDRLNDDKTIDIHEFQLLKRWKREKSNWTPEAISRYGFLYVDNWNTDDEFPDFVHRSFAEFFIAQFAIQDLYDLDEDDDDEMSENEIKLRVKLLMQMSYEYVISEFILSFIDNHKSKKMHKHFFELITSNEIQKLIVGNESLELNLIEIFSVDEKFLKEFRFDDNKTIFQYSINENRSTNILKVVDIYKRCFGADWINHTGYSLNANFSMPNYENIDEILRRESDKMYNALKKLFEIFILIDQLKMPQNDILKFLSNNFDSICGKIFKSSFLMQRLLKFIQNNFHSCKNEFLRMIMKNIRLKPLFTEYSVENVKKFMQKLEEFLSSDETIPVDDIKVCFIKLNLCLFGMKSVISSYEEEKITKSQIQQFFIKNSLKFVDYTSRYKLDMPIEDFIISFKEIFDAKNERSQVKEFLEMQCEDEDGTIKNHTVLSYLDDKIKFDKNNSERGEKLKLFQSTLLEMAKQIGMTDNEIEKLSQLIT